MPKATLTLLLLVLGLSLCAQSRFGLFAGPQITSAKYKVEGYEQSTSQKYGFNAGMHWKIPFDNNLYFTPAIFYSLKGYKAEFNRYVYPPGANASDNNTTIHTAELAFLLQVDFGKQPSHFFFRGGPTLDFQLKGTERFHENGGETSRNMKYSFGDYGRYAANFLLQLGYESKGGFQVFGTYSHGMTNLNNADEGPSIKHRVFGLGFGYFLN